MSPLLGELAGIRSVRLVARAKNSKTINEISRGRSLIGQVLRWVTGRPSVIGVSPSLCYCFWKSDPDISGVGRNLQIDYRFAGGAADRLRQYAAELVALAPDVIVTVGSITVAPAQQATRTIPIVFTGLTDPVGAGIVQSLARPGGNATGFSNFEYSMSGKWWNCVSRLRPKVRRAAVLRDPTAAAGVGQFAGIQGVAQSLGVEPHACPRGPAV